MKLTIFSDSQWNHIRNIPESLLVSLGGANLKDVRTMLDVLPEEYSTEKSLC